MRRVAFGVSLGFVAFIGLTARATGTADSSFALRFEVPAAKKGERGVAKIHIAPGAGYHMNKDYPTQVRLLEIPKGVWVDRIKQNAKDAVKFEEAGAEFDVTFTSAEAGSKVITGE